MRQGCTYISTIDKENWLWTEPDGRIRFCINDPHCDTSECTQPIQWYRKVSRDSLLRMIATTPALNFADCIFTDTVFLSDFAHVMGDTSIIETPLSFFNCIFLKPLNSVPEDTFSIKRKLIFKSDVVFTGSVFPEAPYYNSYAAHIANCTFQGIFIFSGYLAGKVFTFSKCRFSDICDFNSSGKAGGQLELSECKMPGTCIVTSQLGAKITDCELHIFALNRSLNRNVIQAVFANTFANPQQSIIALVKYQHNFLMRKYSKVYFESTVDTFENFYYRNKDSSAAIEFSRCNIKYLDIANSRLWNFELNNVVITGAIDITKTTFNYQPAYRGHRGFESAYFPVAGTRLLTTYTSFLPDSLRFGINLQKLCIQPLVQNFADTTYLLKNDIFYNQVIEYCARQLFARTDIGDDLKLRFTHEKEVWKTRYHLKNLATCTGFANYIHNLGAWLVGSFLEDTVATGYHGEGRFFLWVALFILGFSIFYFVRPCYRSSVIDYINCQYNKSAADLNNFKGLQLYQTGEWFRDYLRILWFSILVFLDPRLPVNVFNLKDGLFVWVAVEWFIGVLYILLFLIYLASQYSFVRALVGI